MMLSKQVMCQQLQYVEMDDEPLTFLLVRNLQRPQGAVTLLAHISPLTYEVTGFVNGDLRASSLRSQFETCTVLKSEYFHKPEKARSPLLQPLNLFSCMLLIVECISNWS